MFTSAQVSVYYHILSDDSSQRRNREIIDRVLREQSWATLEKLPVEHRNFDYHELIGHETYKALKSNLDLLWRAYEPSIRAKDPTAADKFATDRSGLVKYLEAKADSSDYQTRYWVYADYAHIETVLTPDDTIATMAVQRAKAWRFGKLAVAENFLINNRQPWLLQYATQEHILTLIRERQPGPKHLRTSVQIWNDKVETLVPAEYTAWFQDRLRTTRYRHYDCPVTAVQTLPWSTSGHIFKLCTQDQLMAFLEMLCALAKEAPMKLRNKALY